jgi:hypothetical protein
MRNILSLAVLSLSLLGGVASADAGRGRPVVTNTIRDQRVNPTSMEQVRDHRGIAPIAIGRPAAPVIVADRGDYRRDRDDRDDQVRWTAPAPAPVYRGDADDYRGDRDDYRGDRDDYRGDRDDFRGDRDDALPIWRSQKPMPAGYRRAPGASVAPTKAQRHARAIEGSRNHRGER